MTPLLSYAGTGAGPEQVFYRWTQYGSHWLDYGHITVRTTITASQADPASPADLARQPAMHFLKIQIRILIGYKARPYATAVPSY